MRSLTESCTSGLLETHAQKEPRLTPVVPHGSVRYPAELGDLRELEPAEEVEIHQLGEGRVDVAQRVERLAQTIEALRLEPVAGRPGVAAELGELELAAPLLGAAGPEVVDHETTHRAG